MSDKPFFLETNEGVGQASPADDFLHPEQNSKVQGDTLTETQYLGFNIPEHGIHALGYLWHHPNLHVLTGGLMAWRGMKRYAIAAELFDVRAFLNDSPLRNDLYDVQLENSYAVRVIEPMKRLHMSYEDRERENFVDLDYTAVTSAVMFGNGMHFEQAMRVKGKLVLRGQSFNVDGFNVRDRSWGKLRPENPMGIPPVAWMTCWFGEDLILACSLMDHVGSSPQASGKFAVPVERALSSGWVAREGRMTQIVKAQKKIERDPDTMLLRSVQLHLTEEGGRETTLRGKLIASCPWGVWPNVIATVSLVRWEMDGRIGHGDCQDVLWTDYMNAWQGKTV